MFLERLPPSLPKSMKTRKSPTRAFTIIEVLVVVSVIGVMMMLMLPALRRSLRQASSTVCLHNLREISRAIHEYRMDNDGVLPDVQPPDAEGRIDPHSAAWYGRLLPRYLATTTSLICPSDPARELIDTGSSLRRHPDPANASSYGMNAVIRDAERSNLDRRGPTRPLETILLADLGPDNRVDGKFHRTGGWLPWDDGFHAGLAGMRDSWLTGRHFGHINVLTIGGAVKRVRTVELMEDRITSYYRECAAGGCPLCLDSRTAHYSFAPARIFWWTGPIRDTDSRHAE